MKCIKKIILIGQKFTMKDKKEWKKMYHHFILLHSDYSKGRRIALHKSDTSIENLSDFLHIMNNLKGEFPHLSFGFHHLQTESRKWPSVQEYDMFFSDVFAVNDVEAFARLISEDDKVSALDVANLITTKINCTHLKLQKLLFFFYSKYIKKYGATPFSEKFLAWDYGPVVPEVYDAYKKYGRSNIGYAEDNTTTIIKEEPFKLSVYSRFKKTPIYGKILDSLDETLKEYGDFTANKLVSITHQKNSPWDKVFQGGRGRNNVIDEGLIKKYKH